MPSEGKLWKMESVLKDDEHFQGGIMAEQKLNGGLQFSRLTDLNKSN
jgi:hypothetical protein